ncbi:MAG: cytochrome b/b6 domain-containing protein [Anaerolineae bacterium]|nr:cytochrome b/b6 domain-containing protein [Anaerolineae bacterium]MCO5198023.1 cytochrome b/b6 domain-containing protein [Anaerolineae bacterium]
MNRSKLLYSVLTGMGVLLMVAALGLVYTDSAEAQSSATPTLAPLHPTFALLDENGTSVLDSGNPVSTMQTCGSCHDTAFIQSHSFHSDAGLSSLSAPGTTGSGRDWDVSNGIFGRFNPLTYRYLSAEGDEHVDLTTAEWLMVYGPRHVGGGPATTSQYGVDLRDLAVSAENLETSIVDPQTGDLIPWDWDASGTVEMNCFLCHLDTPNNDARTEALQSGAFGWANSATLLGTGIIERVGDEWQWNEAAFGDDGKLLSDYVTVRDPSDTNCAQCHGLVHTDSQTPLVLEGCEPTQWSTITTGQIQSAQKLSNSGMNLSDKDDLSRSWDVHAERVVGCTDCHYSLNNPIYYQERDETQPDHLQFDPRRIDFGEYLQRPVHEFAKGASAQGVLAPELDNTLRRCESCHDAEGSHDWLPYAEKHFDAIACETCHIPDMRAPARQTLDWTVLSADSTPTTECRGIEGDLIVGYQPVLLPRDNGDGTSKLAPHNLITAWYWVYGDPERPVPYRDLEAAWLDGDTYHDDINETFDANSDGQIDESELLIDNEAKEAVIAARIAALGLENPRIVGEIQPYTISHNVTHGDFAVRECATCHSDESRITTPIRLSSNTPGGVTPTFVGDTNIVPGGEIYSSEDGALYFRPNTDGTDDETGLYILGHNSVWWIDWLGAALFAVTVVGVAVHGSLRFLMARRHGVENGHSAETHEEYMYGVYERLWHWLQTAVIFGLLFTGMVIHKPAQFGIFSFPYVVQVHNILAFLLVANAFLALFYHLASGEIKQFLPQPRGFFIGAIEQAHFYLYGIFKGEPHPYEKTRQRKMNPLQQATYFGLLNILLPLQIIVGILMWGAQRWPDIVTMAGGLPILAPVHTLISWLLATFIVMHIYLTTTGPTPTANLKAMIGGWEEVEGTEETIEGQTATD